MILEDRAAAAAVCLEGAKALAARNVPFVCIPVIDKKHLIALTAQAQRAAINFEKEHGNGEA